MDQYQVNRQAPEKGRETSSSQSVSLLVFNLDQVIRIALIFQAAMRRTPTGHIPQPVPVKKEVQSPQTPEEMMRRPHMAPYEMFQMPPGEIFY